MFSKQYVAQLRKEFWTVFGLYMSPINSCEGEKINWINYKTGIKGLQFKMYANQGKASIGIVLTEHDLEKQEFLFNQLLFLKEKLYNSLQEEWTWTLHTIEEDKIISKIYTEKKNLSILKKEDWPELITFFKSRMIALDKFWSAVKYGFEGWQ